MSTNYSAAIDTSDIVASYGEEGVWSTLPSVQFKQLRLTGESLSENKQRNRPNEIKPDGVVSHAITTQVGVEGSFNFALSAATFDDFIAGSLNSSFSTPLSVSSAAIDAAAPNQFTGIDFVAAGIVAGQWVRVGGFAAANNNGYFRVTVVTDTTLTVEGAAVTNELSAGTITIEGSMVRNGVSFRSFYFQKKLATALFLRYAGAYITQMQLSASVGNFVEGSFGVLAKSELKSTTDASTGAVANAPSGRVIDTVAGVADVLLNGLPITAPAQSLQLNVTKQNARGQYAIGSSAAQGMGRGTIDVNGSLMLYFADFTMYDLYKNETDVRISLRLTDDAGAGYIITLPAATLMNPSIVAGGPDTDVMAEFQLEGNPAPASDTVYSGIIMQVDRFT